MDLNKDSLPNQPLPQPEAVSSPGVSFPESPNPSLPPTENPPGVEVNSTGKQPILKIVLLGLLSCLVLVGGFFLVRYLLAQLQAKKQITLTYWGLFEPDSVMQPIIADYQSQHPNIKIDYQFQNLKLYRERLQSALERKEAPDIFRIHQSWAPMFGELLSPLPTTIYDPATFKTTFYPSAQESLNYKGQYVGIPLMYDGLALFYNEELFSAAGQTPPKTWDDLRKSAIELTTKDDSGKITTAGVALGTTANVDHWSDILGLMMLQNGVELNGSLDKLAIDALNYFTLFIKTDEVWSETLPSSTMAFAGGNLAMYFGPSWRVFDILALNPNLKFKIVPVPQLPGSSIAWSSFWAEAVSKDSLHQKEAWEFLQYLSSKETLQKLYQTESSLRLFGEPYPRVDMADLTQNEPNVAAFVQQAPYAKNWFLSSNTSDNGINDKIIKYFGDAVNAVNLGQETEDALKTTSDGVSQVLRQYGITTQ